MSQLLERSVIYGPETVYDSGSQRYFRVFIVYHKGPQEPTSLEVVVCVCYWTSRNRLVRAPLRGSGTPLFRWFCAFGPLGVPIQLTLSE